jgi:hypothetical protein
MSDQDVDSGEAYPERTIQSATILSDALKQNTQALKTVSDRYRYVWVAIIVMVIAVCLSLYAAFTAQSGVDKIEANRAETRVAACEQDNIRIDQHNKLTEAVRGILTLSNVPNATRTAEQQARIDAFFANSNNLLNETLVPSRDCSPAGLDAYFTTTIPSKSDG